MHSVALIGLLCASAIRAASGVNPTAPGPGQSFNEGADCPIQWDLDTTGKWTSFSIDLMSGSNTAMTLVTNVASDLDGTKGETSHTWKCPKVTPNSAIYFYQFSQAGSDTTWTTRFTIASASGASTPPANAAQPDGKNIPWGTGHLEGAAAPTTTASSTTPAANTSSTTTTTTTTTPATNSSTSTTTGSTSEALPATNSTTSTTNSTLPTGSTSTATPSTGASTSTVTGTAASSGVTPKLSQSPSTAGQSGSRGSTTSGSTTTPTSGASSLLPASFTLFAMVLVTMLFLA